MTDNEPGKPMPLRRHVILLLACLSLLLAVFWLAKSPPSDGARPIHTPEPPFVITDSAEKVVPDGPRGRGPSREYGKFEVFSAGGTTASSSVRAFSAESFSNSQFDVCLALAEQGTEASTRQLMATILRETDETRRYELVKTLQAITNPVYGGILFESLTNEWVNGCLLLALVDAVPRLATPELARRLVEVCRNTEPESGRLDWLLDATANLRGVDVGGDVIDTCGALLMTETNILIQASLATALARDGSPASLDALIEKIEVIGSTNTQDALVVTLSGTLRGESLGFLLGEFESTTNPVIKWAVGSAIARIRHLDKSIP